MWSRHPIEVSFENDKKMDIDERNIIIPDRRIVIPSLKFVKQCHFRL